MYCVKQRISSKLEICFDLVDKKCSTPTRIFLAYRPPSINDSAISYLYQLIECIIGGAERAVLYFGKLLFESNEKKFGFRGVES